MAGKPSYEELEQRVKDLEKESLELKQIKQTLQESDTRYRAITNYTNNGVAVYQAVDNGRDFIFIDFNKAAEKIERIHRNDLIGKSVCKVFPAVKKFGLFEVFQRVWKTGHPEHFPITFYKDNRISGWRDNFVYKLPSGEIVAVYSDETARKLAEEELRESKARLKTILDSVPIGIVIIDKDNHKIFDANPTAAGMIGAPREQIVGAVCHKYICPAEQGQCPVTDLGQTLDNSERVLLTANGETLSIFKTVRSIMMEGKAYLIESFIDITEKKRLETQIRQAQKMEAIGTLAGGIAHDFNNILTAIIGYGEIMDLFDISEDNPIRSSLDQVLKASYRAKDLVHQILTFSRQTEQEKKPLLLSLILKEVLKFLKASLPSTIEIRQYIKKESGPIMADPTQMHQVLMNLCTNAAHAMDDKQGVLEVKLDEIQLNPEDSSKFLDLEPGAYLRLTVSDNGQGMDAEVIGRIFDPFFTTKKHGQGTGMGLSVVHGIVKNHNGAISVESELGTGSTFRIFLPLLKQERLQVQPDTLPPLIGGNESILFVDDEMSLVNLGLMSLQRLGYKITGKTSSKEALEVFRSQPDRFDLVITDLTMPDMTGVELAKKLLRIRPDIPIILCTGFSDKVTPEKAHELGIREFIKKPLGARALAESVRRVLDQRI